MVAAACASPASSPPVSRPAPNTSAGLSIERHQRYYDIAGASVPELRGAIRRLGPAGGDEALTVWDLEWTYGDAPAATGCVLRDVKVTLTVTTTLPRWEPPAGAPARLIESWRTYLEHVRVHEAGHQAIAEQYAQRLVTALGSLRRATCRDVWDAAQRTATGVVEEGRAKNRAYDVETRHGQTQGVVLTP
jgi:predicted secreted Zn-dependent protease